MIRRSARLGVTTLLVGMLGFAGLAPAASADLSAGQWYLQSYGFETVWKTTKGKGVVVAVIDSGSDAAHPDLKDALIPGTDLTGASADGLSPTEDGLLGAHGTAVASLIVGQGAPGSKRVAGVAPEAKVMPIGIYERLDKDLMYKQLPVAIKYAVDHDADVINISFGQAIDEFNPYYDSWTDMLAYAAAHDVVVVAAVGNGWTAPVSGPANMPSVVAVGSVERVGAVSKGVSRKGPEVAIAAPGSTSTCPEATNFGDSCAGYPAAGVGGGYVSFTGSSGASPIVAGTAALIIAAHPDISAADVVNRLISTAKNPAGAGQRTEDLGFGIVDPVAAVTADIPPVAENPLGVPKGTQEYRQKDSAPKASGKSPQKSSAAGTSGENRDTDSTSGTSTSAWVVIGLVAAVVIVTGAAAATLISARRRRRT